jgi:glucose dehydrogenase
MKLKMVLSSLFASAVTVAGYGIPSALADDNGAGDDGHRSDVSCCSPTTKDFPKVGGNLGNQNYSRLSQINKGNVSRLGGAWFTHVQPGTDVTANDNQSSPIVADGVIYIESAQGWLVAVDGATGAIKWTYKGSGVGSCPIAPCPPNPPNPAQTRRGPGFGEGKVFTSAAGGYVVALDKDTGKVVWQVQPGNAANPAGTLGNVGKVAVVYYDGMVYVGTSDANRNAGLALDAKTGALVWNFFGAAAPGTLGGDTWGTTGPTGNNCYLVGGAAPWVHPAIDPELHTVYWTFGNARGCKSSQDGSLRPGTNLFSSSIVALDTKTGAYKWHFQSVHHGFWDMDNVMAPVLMNIRVDGEMRKALYYGSKVGMFYVLDRTNGKPLLGIEEQPTAPSPPQDPNAVAYQNAWPTQPIPNQGGWTENCVVNQPLGTEIPGNPNRAVPNYVQGCLFWPHYQVPILSIPSQNGAADFGSMSYDPQTGLVYTGQAFVAAAHDLIESSNGLRATGEYMTGAIVAVDAATNKLKWKKMTPYDEAHGVGVLTTKGDLLFVGEPDGNLLGLDAATGEELWRFQTGASISASPVAYQINGEEYVAVYAGGTSIPYGSSIPKGDNLWAFKLNGTVAALPAPPPPYVRRPTSGSLVEGSTVGNTVLLAVTSASPTATPDSASVSAMYPPYMHVPPGTTVTFTNPATNKLAHCATQFFEGLFNPKLQPGKSFTYTFSKNGDFYFNDCTDPRPTGRIVVY